MNYAKACEYYERNRRGSVLRLCLVEVTERYFECCYALNVSIQWVRILRAGSRFGEHTCGRSSEPNQSMMPIRHLPREQFIAELKARREVLGQ